MDKNKSPYPELLGLAVVAIVGASLGAVALIWNGFVSPEFGLKPLDIAGDAGLTLLIAAVLGGIYVLREDKLAKK